MSIIDANGDAKKQNEVLVKAAARLQDGNVLDKKIDLSTNSKFSDREAAYSASDEGDKERETLVGLRKKGAIDFSTFTNAISSIDQKETTKKFSDAVDKFASSVGDIGGKEKPGTGNLFGFFGHPGSTDTKKSTDNVGPTK
jgi:hypothetical protein